jgi:hypothetical protein
MQEKIINESKEYVGTVELGEYLQSLRWVDMDNPVKEALEEFSRCRTNSYFIRSKKDVCRNAKITHEVVNSQLLNLQYQYNAKK